MLGLISLPNLLLIDASILAISRSPSSPDFFGFAESSHPVEIRARIEGFLDKIAYEEGQIVHEDDLLFQLDPRQFIARVEQAKGEVARIQFIFIICKDL